MVTSRDRGRSRGRADGGHRSHGGQAPGASRPPAQKGGASPGAPRRRAVRPRRAAHRHRRLAPAGLGGGAHRLVRPGRRGAREGPAPFTSRDYRRLDGVRNMLAARHIVLPAGSPADPPGLESVQAVAAAKDARLAALLSAGDSARWPARPRCCTASGPPGWPRRWSPPAATARRSSPPRASMTCAPGTASPPPRVRSPRARAPAHSRPPRAGPGKDPSHQRPIPSAARSRRNQPPPAASPARDGAIFSAAGPAGSSSWPTPEQYLPASGLAASTVAVPRGEYCGR